MDTLRGCPMQNGKQCSAGDCQWWNEEWKDCTMNVVVRYLRAQDVRATFNHPVPAEFLEGSRK
ncbi:hypothetical protein McpSp1_15480 [Methanocorpusculaceae archaeon Sp1]|uniref:Uncharacterized protein n=1 Tax=Methanorbis furvi TaxID=3028299 RepID=A0AAE4SAD4_9EURY|nr:hypothetical protein [Methanocorpusculaceae archaeon Sp1]MDV0441543.1 hypothetical protein [Methanocorpusculaceae archaeon Ag1]